jgi:hypothetical protein
VRIGSRLAVTIVTSASFIGLSLSHRGDAGPAAVGRRRSLAGADHQDQCNVSGRRAICAAVDMLRCKDTTDTGPTLEDLRQTGQARHPANLQVCTRLERSVQRPVDRATLAASAAQVSTWAGS